MDKKARELLTGREEVLELIADYIGDLFAAFDIVLNKDNIKLIIRDNSLLFLVKTINRVSREGLLELSSNIIIEDVRLTLKENGFPELDNLLIINLFEQLKNIVNRHNLYNRNVEEFTKNYVVELMFRVAINPANLIQAQTSVDKTTGEPKRLASEKAKYLENILKRATPGNIGNMFQSIVDNHVGKDVIGISAVGLKTFFALTQYVNTLLNTGNLEQINLIFSKPITFNGKLYYTIANANGNSPIILQNLLILEILKQGNERDSALILSALLSLATDFRKL